jgi:hypothetical protein
MPQSNLIATIKLLINASTVDAKVQVVDNVKFSNPEKC